MSDLVHLPIALASGLVLGGLTAPAMRAAIVLLCRADASGRISIVKPLLERQAGLRLDNAHAFLERLRTSEIVIKDETALAFSSIDYTPGIQKRLAGIISGQVAPELVSELAQPRHGGRRIEIDLGELRRLSTAPGILLWLRLAIERQRDEDGIRLRLTELDAASIFGSYLSRAAIKRTTARDGEHAWTGLSRIWSELVEPAVKDLWDAVDGIVVDAKPGALAGRGHGRAWAHIDITLEKLRPTLSLRELAQATKSNEEYSQRKHVPRSI